MCAHAPHALNVCLSSGGCCTDLASCRFLAQANHFEAESRRPYSFPAWNGRSSVTAPRGRVGSQISSEGPDRRRAIDEKASVVVTWPGFSVSLMSLWLIFSPTMLDFRHEELAWFNAVVAGLLLLLTVIARAPGALRAVGIASIGLWTAASPWALGIEAIEAAFSGALTGLCVLGLAIPEVRQLAHGRQSGAGSGRELLEATPERAIDVQPAAALWLKSSFIQEKHPT